MGVRKNRVTREVYTKIKKYINDNGYTAKDDPIVIKKFGYKESTVRGIRNTDSYDEYLERVYRFHGHPRKDASRSKAQTKPAGTPPVEHTTLRMAAAETRPTSLDDIIRELESRTFEDAITSGLLFTFLQLDNLRRWVKACIVLSTICLVALIPTVALLVVELVK